MNPTLQGYTSAVIESVGDDRPALARLTGDLRAVSHFVHSNPELHAALTDTTVPGPARRAILLDLLDDRVSAPARRLTAFAASTVRAPESPSALHWLIHRADHAAEGIAEVDDSLSFLASRERVGGYATARYEDLPTGALEEIEDELFRFARTVESTPALRAALTDRDLPVAVRRAVVDELLGAKVLPATLDLVRFVVLGGRARDFVGSLDWLVVQTAKARGWRVARVRSASPIAPEQETLLSDSLSRLSGAPVELQVTVNPDLLGGVLVEIGDLRLDATARGRLDNLREHLLPTGWGGSDFGQAGRGTHEGAH